MDGVTARRRGCNTGINVVLLQPPNLRLGREEENDGERS